MQPIANVLNRIMKNHSVIISIGAGEYRKYPVAFNPEPQIDDLFEVGGQKIPVVRVSGFDVRLSYVTYDNKLIAKAEKEGFYRSD